MYTADSFVVVLLLTPNKLLLKTPIHPRSRRRRKTHLQI